MKSFLYPFRTRSTESVYSINAGTFRAFFANTRCGQAVIHNQLTLGIVVASDNETATALTMKEILILAHDIGLTVRFKTNLNGI